MHRKTTGVDGGCSVLVGSTWRTTCADGNMAKPKVGAGRLGRMAHRAGKVRGYSVPDYKLGKGKRAAALRDSAADALAFLNSIHV